MQSIRKILLIEDDDVDAEIIMRALRPICQSCDGRSYRTCAACLNQDRYEVVRESRLLNGLHELEKYGYDLVLLDLGLPDVSKTKPLKKLRYLYPYLPIVVLTGNNDKSTALESLREGAQDFIIKGEVGSSELRRCITYAIERHNLKRELEIAANELMHKSAILESVFTHMGDGVVVTNQYGELTLFNPAAQQLLGADEKLHIVRRSTGIVMPLGANLFDEDILQDLPLELVLEGEVVDGTEIEIQSDAFLEGKYVSVTARPIKDQGAAVSGSVFVLHDVTKRRKTEQLKDEFVSIVSHELRTPLTSINGSLGLVLGGIAGEVDEEVREMLEIAQRNSDRLVRLINDLLDVQKLEAGKMELTLQPLQLHELIEKALEANEGYALQYNVCFSIESQKNTNLYIEGDEDRLLQVLTNLLSNAAKYSPHMGRIDIRYHQVGGNQVIVKVKDYGTGIPIEFHDAIFGKFNQADTSRTRQKEGTGLGLSISKSIVMLHGGEIGFESEPGQGALFYFTLPLLETTDQTTQVGILSGGNST